MNYSKHYELLISRAKNRLVEGYTEKHHIVPRCLGGSDEAENLVRLTPEEHYVAHQLLVKMYPGHPGLVSAAFLMTSTDRSNEFSKPRNKVYGWLKKKYSENAKGREFSDQTRKKMSEAKKGVSPWNKGKVGAQVAWNKGKRGSQAAWNKGKEGNFKGMNHSDDTKKKMSESIKKSRPKFTCIGCKTEMTVQNYKRHIGACEL